MGLTTLLQNVEWFYATLKPAVLQIQNVILDKNTTSILFKLILIIYICIVHTAVLFQSLVSVCRLTQHVNLLSKTHCAGDMFRLPCSHHQTYVNVRTITDHCVCL
jgi:hypothetical protein